MYRVIIKLGDKTINIAADTILEDGENIRVYNGDFLCALFKTTDVDSVCRIQSKAGD